MNAKTEAALQEALGYVLEKVRANMQPEEYLKVTQAALNLAHATSLLAGAPRTKGGGA